ncbi:MAG: acyl-CoA thioesterase [Solirubrobacterales bacterium]|nr:acyl-CoA thioesterase [Solirubrobacterales bacterium]
MAFRETSVDLQLRWSDFDMLGHLNQAVYHQLLEEARAALTVGAGPDFPWVLARVELDYLAEVRPEHGPLTVHTQVVEIGRSKFSLAHEITRATGEVAARGTSVIVAWDIDARRSRPLTPEERRAFGADDAEGASRG